MKFVLDENKNLVEAYSKEEVLALLEQAIEDGSLESIDADSAFVSKLKSLHNGTTHHVEFVTQAQYNQLQATGQLVANTYYHITDDTTADNLQQALNTLQQTINDIIDGNERVGEAQTAATATIATIAQYASADASKGTIEERLTNLGFKQGNATFTDMEHYSVTRNELKRQGNYVIGNIVALALQAVTPISNFTITLPTNFRPKETQTYNAAVGTSAGAFRVVVTITTSGVFSISNPDFVTSPITDFSFNFGFEANPIT